MSKSRLGRELILVLLIKAIVIGLAAIFVFGPSQRPRIDATEVEAHLLDTPETAAAKPSLSKSSLSKPSAPKIVAPRSIVP